MHSRVLLNFLRIGRAGGVLKYSLRIGLGLCFVVGASAQQKHLQFNHLTPIEGLSSSIAVSVIQDYKGFLWFGTHDGLNRYDGSNIVVYKNNPLDSNSLIENHAQSIFEDHDNNLYIGTWAGLARYDRDRDRFVNYMFDCSSPLCNRGMIVNHIAEDTLGNLWLATNIGAIYFNRHENTIVVYEHNPDDPHSISSTSMNWVYIDKQARLWAATRQGLNLFRPQTGTFQHIARCTTHGEDISTALFLEIIEDKEGNIWFGSDVGLFCLEYHTGVEEFALTHYKNDPNDPFSFSPNRAKSLFVDIQGTLWVGTVNGGLNIFNKEKRNFYHYRLDRRNPTSLNNESIHGITQDRGNNLWMCTWGGGVNYLSNSTGFIIHYQNIPEAPHSLSRNIVSCFVKDRFNRAWVGTDGGGFNLFDETTGQFTVFNKSNTTIKSDAVICMYPGKDDIIWMGTWEGGLIRHDYRNNRTTTFTTLNSRIPDNTFYSIAQDAAGDLWLGSYRHGLVHYQVKENAFTAYSPTTTNTEVFVTRISHDGRVYLGRAGSTDMYIFIPDEKRFDRYSIIPDSINRGNSVYDILIENDTCAWLATERGLCRLNPANSNRQWFFRDKGTAEISVRGLAFDHSGMLWVTTNAGIYRFDYRNNTLKQFTVSDGLQSNDFYRASILTAENGTILAGGTNGFNLITPAHYSENRSVPEVVITDLRIFNEPVNIGATGSPLEKQISETKKITLSYKQSVLTFYFASLDFTNPKKNQYAYKMQNFDKDWTYCGNKQEATYTNLNPGRYFFHVKGSNNDGVWNEIGTTLEIFITPPWWKTKIARFGFVISVLCLFLGIYFYRINTLKKQKEELEHLVKKRTREIEEKNQRLNNQNILLEQRQQFIDEQTVELSSSNEKLISLNATKDKLFTIIAHDLKNPFTAILGYCEILARRYDAMNDANRTRSIKIIHDASKKIYALLENLLHWARSQTGAIKYEPEEFLLDDIVTTNIALLENMALEKKYEIKKCIQSGIKVFADRNMVDTVIRNLVTNAIKFTEIGWVGIETVQENDFAKVSIIDTGVGISSDILDTIFDIVGTKSAFGTRGESGTGLGLKICEEFVKINGGSIGVQSELGKGSTFYFTLPNKSPHH
jgi:signal transduction histidine kinase/ligand-binding sensor domain-containing protein